MCRALARPSLECWSSLPPSPGAERRAFGGGTSWSNTDAIEVNPGRAVSGQSNAYMWLDSVRLSNSQTTEHLTLGPGAIGPPLQTTRLRQRTINASTYAVTDRWFHYDQVGSILRETDANGDASDEHHQDAFGNTQGDWEDGLLGGDALGWHHNSKEREGDVGLV